MIEIIKQEISIDMELHLKIIKTCDFNKIKPQIHNGCLRIIKHTNLAYVEPHKIVFNNTLYLFFNGQKFFYVNNLKNKYPLSKLHEYLK